MTIGNRRLGLQMLIVETALQLPAGPFRVWHAVCNDAPMIGNAINKLYMASSEKRLECFLFNCSEVHVEGREFWPIFTEMWTMCDSTWEYRYALLKLLRKHAETRAACDRREDEKAFYNELPERITVYRGCSNLRQRGLAWTTDRGVAEGFAKGHRQIEVPEPVVLKCVVPKSIILATFAFDRKESEVLLDYLRLPRILNPTAMKTSSTLSFEIGQHRTLQ